MRVMTYAEAMKLLNSGKRLSEDECADVRAAYNAEVERHELEELTYRDDD